MKYIIATTGCNKHQKGISHLEDLALRSDLMQVKSPHCFVSAAGLYLFFANDKGISLFNMQ